MKHLKKLLRKEEGFTLVELIVVIVIMGILSQIGLVSFNRYTRKTRAFAARTALRNIKSECEMNRDLGMDPVFTLLGLSSYSIETSNINSCLGESGSGMVSAIPEQPDDNPSYSYDYEKGTITCTYKNAEATPYPECKKAALTKTKAQLKVEALEKDLEDYIAKKGDQGAAGFCSSGNQQARDKLVRQGRLSSTRSAIQQKRCGTGQLRIELDWVLIAKKEALANAKFAASPEGMAQAKAEAEVLRQEKIAAEKAAKAKTEGPSCGNSMAPRSEEILCAADPHVLAVVLFDEIGADKWFCNQRMVDRIPGRQPNAKAKSGLPSNPTCAEMHNYSTCRSGGSACIENYVDPSRLR